MSSTITTCNVCPKRVAYSEGIGLGLMRVCLEHYKEYWIDCKVENYCCVCGNTFIKQFENSTRCYTCYKEGKF